MKSDMEHVKVFLTKENIKYIKSHGSFAKIINLLVVEMKDNADLECKILNDMMKMNS